MAITLPTDFQKRALANAPNRALGHLYREASNYIALATHSVVAGTVQYLSCVKDVGSASTTWNIDSENNVTLSSSNITLRNYTSPEGYSLSGLLASYQFSGKKIQVYEGFIDEKNPEITLADFLCTFDGLVDDIKRKKNGDLIIVRRTQEFPDTDSAGREIHFAE